MIESTMMRTQLSLNHLLERAGRLYPATPIVSRRPDKSLVRHTFADFYRRSQRLASALRAAGLRRGDRVATLCWNHHAHLECYFGIPAAGGVMHTLNLRLAPDEIGWIANHAEDRFLVVDDVLLPLYRQFEQRHRFERVIVFPFSGAPMAGGYDDYEALLDAAPGGFDYEPHDENDAVSMCYTSGTTGRPKGVVYSHRSTVLHTLVGIGPQVWSLSSRDVVLPVTPMFHANSWGVPYGAVMQGSKLVFPGPHLHPQDLLDLIEQEPPTLALGVPTIWLSMIQLYEANPGRWKFPPNLRTLVGGAAVPESLIRAYARHGVEVVQGWGMTETSPVATTAIEKTDPQQMSDDQRFRIRATAGMAAPLVELRIVDDAGECAWDGNSVGEIQVRGPFITGAYHQVGAESDKFTADGWLRTGDVAAIDPEGYVRITDRTKDLIKSGGEWISSVDLENAIMAHPAVAEAAVIAVPHPKWSERPLACIVVKPGAAVTDRELREFLAPQFAKWQLPDAYVVIDAIPRTSTGKFWKARLRERFADWKWGADADAA
ncbi:MAG TPA: long-chain fatty acid--CoA ligase [Burkholderiaceae bacterium]|nr:long-chain fatty acid--CoA ligase [Burkholderiaceae bacterium]